MYHVQNHIVVFLIKIQSTRHHIHIVVDIMTGTFQHVHMFNIYLG